MILGIFNTYMIYAGRPYLTDSNRSLYMDSIGIEDVCYLGFKGVVEKDASSYLLEESLYKNLSTNRYSNVDIIINDKNDFRLIKKINDSLCKLLLRDHSKKTPILRSFYIDMKSHDDYPFQFKISDIREVNLENEDLKWD